MRLPILNGNTEEIDYPLAQAMVDMALENGVNYFDTAWIYHKGQSEVLAGRALSRHPRNKYNLATKLPLWEVDSFETAENIFKTQLEKCRTDYIDFYLMHNIDQKSFRVMKDLGLYDYFLQKKKEGVVRHLGFSVHDSPSHLKALTDQFDWDFAQIQLNYIDWDTLKAREMYGLLESKNIPVVIMEPLRGGSLAAPDAKTRDIFQKSAPDNSVASWGIRYAASLPGVMTVLSGMSKLDQLEDNLKVMNNFTPLSQEERQVLEEAAKAYRASHAIPCTSCRYCEDCPQGVDIPTNFAIYNQYKEMSISDPVAAHLVFENNQKSLLVPERADQCVACGECVSHCPQSINVPVFLKEIADFSASLHQ